MTSLIRFVFRHRNVIYNTECKRFAGHSKWANIRHTKMAKDQEKSAALRNFINKMKIAIAEGKSSKPDDNINLARIIDQAKKNSMPMATIKAFLDKAQKSKLGSQSVMFESRGPSGCVVLMHLLTDNIGLSRNTLNHHLKKTQFSPSENASQNLFEQKGIILAEVDDRDIDKITEDAIEVGAEEAEKLKENDKEFLQFTCSYTELMKVKNKLEELNYKIIQADVEFIPTVFVKLTDEELEKVSKLYDRLSNLDEVVRIYNNITVT